MYLLTGRSWSLQCDCRRFAAMGSRRRARSATAASLATTAHVEATTAAIRTRRWSRDSCAVATAPPSAVLPRDPVAIATRAASTPVGSSAGTRTSATSSSSAAEPLLAVRRPGRSLTTAPARRARASAAEGSALSFLSFVLPSIPHEKRTRLDLHRFHLRNDRHVGVLHNRVQFNGRSEVRAGLPHGGGR